MKKLQILVNGLNFSIMDNGMKDKIGFYFIFECNEESNKSKLNKLVLLEFLRRKESNKQLFVEHSKKFGEYLLIDKIDYITQEANQEKEGFTFYEMTFIEALKFKIYIKLVSVIPPESSRHFR